MPGNVRPFPIALPYNSAHLTERGYMRAGGRREAGMQEKGKRPSLGRTMFLSRGTGRSRGGTSGFVTVFSLMRIYIGGAKGG